MSIYLDYAATTPVAPVVLEQMLPFFSERFGNGSSIHSVGREAKKYIGCAREIVQKALNAGRSDEVFFVSGGTEADNLAIMGVMNQRSNHNKHMITTQIEHPAVLHTCQHLEQRGYSVTYICPNRDGRIDPSQIEAAIREDTVMLSVMTANNEIGTIQPMHEIGQIAKKYNLIFHTDAVQAMGAVSINVYDWAVDLLSITGHKIYGPQGIGALYVRRGIRMEPMLFGGEQERKRRPGTENLAGIVGLGAAVQNSVAEMKNNNIRLTKLRDQLIDEILKNITGSQINGGQKDRLPNNANFLFRGIDAEVLLLRLDMQGIAVSAGSACSSGSLEPSHVLLAIGRTYEEAQSSIRFSLGESTTEEDIQTVVRVLKEIIA